MLSLLFIYLFITISCLLTGFLVYTYILKPNDVKNHFYKPVICYLITGLITITLVCQAIILFLPLNIYPKSIFIIILIILSIINKKKISAFSKYLLLKIQDCSPVIKAAFFATSGLILVMNAGPTQMDDTDSYHIQMVKWIQEYGTVPGIANLHERLGFNSSWFSSIAFFTFSYKNINFFTALNGMLSVWFTGYIFILIKRNSVTFPRLAISSFAIIALSLFCWPLIRGNAATCNYDFITTFIIFVLFTETILSSNKIIGFTFQYEWLIWPVYLLTIRLVNFPLLILSISIFFILLKQKKMKIALSGICFSLLLAIPFFVRNVMLSGYIFFPSLSFDWFAVDWKVDKEKIQQLLYYIKYYNRVGTGFQDLNITASLKFPQWISYWFHFMFPYDKLLLIPGLCGISTVLFLNKKITTILPFYRNIFFFAIIVQLLFWFLIAPDPRFVYGCLLCGIMSMVILLSSRLITSIWKRIGNLFITVFLSAIFLFTIRKVYKENYHNWFLPLSLPEPAVQNITVNNIQIHIPEKIMNNWNPRCYGTSLPCSYKIDSGLQARGTTITDGFRIRK
jgi:hypothetical protein